MVAISSKYLVSVEQCNTYDFDEVIATIKKSLDDIGGIKEYIKSGEKVLLKPNLLTTAVPEKAVTTHPVIIKALIKLIKSVNAIPFVGDSPAIKSFKSVIAASGIGKVCEDENVSVIHFSNSIKIENKKAKIMKFPEVSKEIFEFDKLINIPKLKNHILTKITVAVKNLFGVIPGIKKAKLHFRFKDVNDFANMLLDLNLVVKPVLNIVDGIIGMQGEGPVAGEPIKTGVIIAGNDTVAVDIISAIIMNYEPYKILTNYLARQRKIGGYSIELIEVKGVKKLNSVIAKDFKKTEGKKSTKIFPNIINNFISNLIIKKPVINKNICQACGDCVKVCPADAIALTKNYAVINYNLCIKCYCCAEICPYKAISLKIKI